MKAMTKLGIASPVILAVLQTALAAEARKPAAPPLDPSVSWTAIIGSIVAVLVICVLGFMSSRRTHLD
jgi:hypothetical protein